jgi:hypothetical protein
VAILLHVEFENGQAVRNCTNATPSPPKRRLRLASAHTQSRDEGSGVKSRTLFASIIVAILAAPLAAQAQGVPGGIAHGVREGGRIAGPVGAVVGGAVGGVIGGIEGVLGIQHVHPAPPPRVYRHRARPRKTARRHVRRTGRY